MARRLWGGGGHCAWGPAAESARQGRRAGAGNLDAVLPCVAFELLMRCGTQLAGHFFADSVTNWHHTARSGSNDVTTQQKA